jgi:hypothetical protein
MMASLRPPRLLRVFPKRIDRSDLTTPVTALRTLIRYNERFVLYPIQKDTTP